jgi:hypothetical protein
LPKITTMKNLFFAYFILFSFLGFGQDYNKFSMGINVGGHYFSGNTTHEINGLPTHHFDLSGRYMFNNRFGL